MPASRSTAGASRLATKSAITKGSLETARNLEIFSAIVLTIPIIFPTILALGFDPVWFGVLVVRVGEIGLITPPIGMNVFVISGATGLPAGKVFRGIIPFFLADILHVALLVAVPGISLFLVNTMMN
jgi:C4-dicarboxylate transporter DctM subunit